MHILQTDYQYFPFALPTRWSGSAASFEHDQPKMNLLWLVFPGVDDLAHTSWSGNAYTESIDEYLDLESRRHLQGPPGAFLTYWDDLTRHHRLKIAEGWPTDYRVTMGQRAAECSARLRADVPVNAVVVDFKRRVKVA